MPNYDTNSTPPKLTDIEYDPKNLIRPAPKKTPKTFNLNQEQMNQYGNLVSSGLSVYSGILNNDNPVEQNDTYNSIMQTGSTAFDALSKSGSIGGIVGQAGRATLGLVDLGNNLFGKTVDKFTLDQDLVAKQGADYSGTFDYLQKISEKTGKRYGGLTGKAGKIKKELNEALPMLAAAQRVNNNASDLKSRAWDPNIYMQRQSNLYGDIQPYAISAKNGSVLKRVSKIINFTKEPAQEVIEEASNEINKFQKGGSFNLVPEGALHSRKHNIDIEGITKKGIPVVSESEDGEVQQQAEIEHSEIILRLEVTEKLEELAKDGSDEAAIDAGKLLVKEILHNTEDKTGIITNVE